MGGKAARVRSRPHKNAFRRRPVKGLVCVLRRSLAFATVARVEPPAAPRANVNTRAVLVLSTDDLAGALLGALAETAGLAPAFAGESETPRDALRRLRPDLVLIDCEHELACTEQFLGPVRMTGATALVFGRGADAQRLRALGDAHRLRVFTLPVDAEELARVIRETTNGK